METHGQIAQQARRIREHQLREQLPIGSEPQSPQLQYTVSTNRQLGQQARRIQEHQFIQQQLPIARRPLFAQPVHPISFRHSSSRCEILCSFCGAEHWIEEKLHGSSQRLPKFSACCMSGAIEMDKFDDPPEPLYTLLMNCTPGIYSAVVSFANDKQLENFVITFGIITTPLLSVPLVSKETRLFMGLMEYTLFAFKANYVIALAPSFHLLGKSLFSHKSISMIPIPCNKLNSA